MVPSVPEAYMEARRQQIIGAAWKCFVEKGFHNTTMQDIFRKSGLSAGAVYNYFTSKEEIVATAAAMSRQNNEQLLGEFAASGEPNPLPRMMRTYIGLLKDPAFVQAASVDLELYAEARLNPAFTTGPKDNLEAILTSLAEIVTQLQQKGVINPDLDHRMVARLFITLYQGAMVQKVIDPNMNLDDYMTVNEALLMGNLLNPNRSTGDE